MSKNKNVRKMSFEKVFLPGLLRLLAAVVISVTTAVLLECTVFQFRALMHKAPAVSYCGGDAAYEVPGDFTVYYESSLVPLTEEEANKIAVAQNSEKLLADYYGTQAEGVLDDTLVQKSDGSLYRRVNVITYGLRLADPYYLGKISLTVDGELENDLGYSVDTYLEGEIKGDTVYCSLDPKIGTGVAKVGRMTDRLEIELITTTDPEPEDVSFTLSNAFAPNLMRILWMSIALLTAAMLIECRKMIVGKPEWCFVLIAMATGLMLICGIGTNQVSYDEHVHAKAAYKLSFSTQIETTETAMQMGGNLLPMFHNPEERELVESYEDLNHDFSWADIGFQSRFVRAENRVYYPLALGFWLGRVLGLSFAVTVGLAKFFNLLTYVAVCFLAIRCARRYQELVCLCALIPNNLFQAASISYDMVVNAFLLLGCVLLFNEFFEPSEKLEWKRLLPMLLCLVIGSLSKPIYILMAGMILFYGKRKFENRVQEWILKLSVVALIGLMLYNIFRPTPVAGSDYHLVGNFSYAGDKRNVGASVTGQVAYIFSNPLTYTLLLLSEMGGMLFSYLLGGKGFFQYGYTGEAPMLATWWILALAVGLAVLRPRLEVDEQFEESIEHKSLGPLGIAATIVMCLGLSAVIWTSMYVSYTAVGADTIRGVQGRYFTPLFCPLLLCLTGGRKTGNMARTGRGRLLFGSMAYLNYVMLWLLVICAYDV